MAQNATIYKVELSVADMDRHYYETHKLTVAKHPSETDERLMVRILAFALALVAVILATAYGTVMLNHWNAPFYNALEQRNLPAFLQVMYGNQPDRWDETLAGAGSLLEHPEQARSELSRIGFDTYVGMGFSNLIAFFIMLTTASTLHVAGITEISTSAQAAEALRPIAGDFAFLLFSLGIVGAGLLALPVLAGSAAYALGELRGWRVGLERKPQNAPAFYGVIALIERALTFWHPSVRGGRA